MIKRSVLACALVIFVAPESAAQTWTAVPNLVYGNVAGQNLLLDLYLPLNGTAPHPLVVWVHGGGWAGGSRFPAPAHATNLCALGYAVASIDYRLSGTAIWPAQIQDCRGAIRWLRANAATYGIDPERVGVWGSSAGGHLVAFLGTAGGVGSVTIGNVTVDLEGTTGGNLGQSSRVQAVCNWFGPTDFLAMRDFPSFDHEASTSPESNLLGAAIQTIPERVATADPITFVSPDDPPMLIMHGTIDTTVPFNQSELLHAAALRRAGITATFVPVQGNGHGGPGFTTPAATALVQAHFNGLLLNAPGARVTVTASDPSASEAGDPAAFDVARSGSVAAPLAVRLTWSGSADPGADYAAADLLVVIPPGAASVTIPVVPQDDALVEGAETVVLTICPDSGYRTPPAQQSASATIADDESASGLPVVGVTAPDASAAEPGSNGGVFLVTRTAPLAAPLVVQYRVGGRARNGIDFQALGGTVTIPAGVISLPVAVVPLDDPAIEPSETVIVTLQTSAAYALGANRTASAFIADNDKNPALPTVSVIASDIAASEPGADAGAFFVTRTLGTGVPLTVQLAISGTAAAGADFAAVPLVATIPPGSSWTTVTITPLDDPAAEGEETVVLSVLPAPGYQIASAPAKTIVIKDDDVPPIAPPALRLEITPLVLGTLVTVSVGAGQPGQAFGFGAASGAGFLDAGPLGHVLIDLATAILVEGGTLGGSGIGSIAFFIPPDPSLANFAIWFQGYALDAVSGTLTAASVRDLWQR